MSPSKRWVAAALLTVIAGGAGGCFRIGFEGIWCRADGDADGDAGDGDGDGDPCVDECPAPDGDVTTQSGPVGSVYDPNDYQALNSGTPLNYDSGTLTFNTDNGSVSHSVDGSLGTGSVDQPNESGNVEMTVFSFSSISLSYGVTIVVTGQRGLVLASRGDLTVGSGVTLSVAGTAGQEDTSPSDFSHSSIGRGGPGAEGRQTDKDGNRAGPMESDPPGLRSGDGGWASSSSQTTWADGRGRGGGLSNVQWGWDNYENGSGGGYGGAGGQGVGHYATVSGGVSYGDDLLEILYGGSGGGGAHAHHNAHARATGGGGGGALELVARGTLDFDGTINAFGGNGAFGPRSAGHVGRSGGGSGGGVLLAATEIVFGSNGSIDASGGLPPGDTSGYGARTGAGGGGGRVAFYTGHIWSNSSVSEFITVDGDDDNDGNGGDLEEEVPGLTFRASEGAVDVRGGDRGHAANRPGAHGTFRVLRGLPAQGAQGDYS